MNVSKDEEVAAIIIQVRLFNACMNLKFLFDMLTSGFKHPPGKTVLLKIYRSGQPEIISAIELISAAVLYLQTNRKTK
jgi:hypothetical protein